MTGFKQLIDSDTPSGIVLTAMGSGGLTVQAIMDGLNLFVLALNVVMALGGLMLLGYRLKRARRTARNSRWNDT